MSSRRKQKRKKHKPTERVVDVAEKKTGEEPAEQTVHQELKPKDNMTGEHWTAKLGVVLAVVVAVIYFLQWRTMIESVDATRRASERENRAWFTIHIRPNEAGQLLMYPLRVENTAGNTPGRHFIVDAWVEVIPISEEPDLSGNAGKHAGYEWDLGELAPRDHIDFDDHRMRTVAGSTAVEMWPITDAENRDIASGQKYVVAYAKASYDDVFHVHHWTQFCMWHSNAAITPADKCADYNRSDETDEP